MLKICLNHCFFFEMKDRNIYLLTKSRLQGTQMCSGNNDYFGIFCYFVEDIMNHSHTLQNVSITSSKKKKLHTLQNVSITRFKELTTIQKRILREH